MAVSEAVGVVELLTMELVPTGPSSADLVVAFDFDFKFSFKFKFKFWLLDSLALSAVR